LAGPGGSAAGPVRATPMVLLPRRHLGPWQALVPPGLPTDLSPRARRLHAAPAGHGAMLFDELLGATRLLPTELETALGELAAAGVADADSYAGLRALLVPASRRTAQQRRRTRHGTALPQMDQAGR